MGPAGAAPVAALMEYGWPGNEEEAGRLLNEDGGLSFLPAGDQREHLRDLAIRTPMPELLDAWRMAAQMPEWATRLCDAVEREIDAGQPGDAIKEWWFGALGMPRLLLIMALRDRKARPADIAMTALLLTFIRKVIRMLGQLMPDGQFALLGHPSVTPPLLVSFMQAPVASAHPDREPLRLVARVGEGAENESVAAVALCARINDTSVVRLWCVLARCFPSVEANASCCFGRPGAVVNVPGQAGGGVWWDVMSGLLAPAHRRRR